MAGKGFSVTWNNTNISLALDPSGTYQHCTLEYSRVAIVRDKLYLDAGETRMMVGNGEPFWEINTRLLWLDLDKPFNYSHYSISSLDKPDGIPNLAEGVAFVPSSPSEARFFAFAGNYPSNNQSALAYVPPPTNADEVGLLWSFDADAELWSTEYGAGTVTGLSGGSATTNPFMNEAYYLGGVQDDWILKDVPDLYVDGMMILNMTDSTWRNETVPGLVTYGAFMEYMPVGEKGMLVVFGGRDNKDGVAYTNGVGNDMSEIRIYDVSSGQWVTQKATGTRDSPDLIPDARVIGCSAMAPAPDNSSYNIYMVGGERQLGGPRIDDAWVLTLPSFTWIKIAENDIGSVGSKCRPFGRQMLLVGSGPLSEAQCQEFFRVLDMTSLEWTNAFDPMADPYLVPLAISSVVGGNATGGAALLAPSDGAESWSSSLEDLFSKTPWGPANFTSKHGSSHNRTSNSTAIPTTSSHSTATSMAATGSKPGAGIIAGASVASFVILALILAAVWWFWIRLRRARSERNNKPRYVDDKPELQAQDSKATATAGRRRASGTEIDGRGIALVPGMHELASPPNRMEDVL